MAEIVKSAESEPLAPSKNLRRVLFVDDERILHNAFSRAFRGVDVDVVTVGSADEGLQLLKKETFAVVVSDLKMPGLDGDKFLAIVADQYPDTVRVLVTGKGDFDTTIRLINSVGLFRFLAKPWETEMLRQTVFQALERFELVSRFHELTVQYSGTCFELEELNRNLESQISQRTSFLLTGLINALDLRDTESRWHSKRVVLYSRLLGSRLGISGDEMVAIERGALLHDIGKVGVSDTILKKRGSLTEEEHLLVQCHSEFGYKILSDIDFLKHASEVVYQHHERWDGSGYPQGLKGEDISFAARVFSVIDAYDAITSDRPYRKAQSHMVGCSILESKSGIWFDPRIVNEWLKVPFEDIDRAQSEVDHPDSE